MNMVFSQPLFYIFFIYGASFLVMSYVVFHGIRNASAITLVTTYYALALFGLTHGTTELIDWIRFIVKITGNGEIEILKYLSQIFLIISFVVLLQFGVDLLTYRNENKRAFRLIPGILFLVFIVVLLIIKTNDIAKAGLIARHSFGFSGALLSGIALCSLANSMKAAVDSKVIKGLLVTAISFGVYAVVGGLIIQPIVGLPIQLFRAACALTIAISSFYILGIFKASE
ncbi:MAG: hypothetical protein LAO06_00555 [Acidobacteriia bacterium]|nr:hypothetical protein [Terriglobia bacterium]